MLNQILPKRNTGLKEQSIAKYIWSLNNPSYSKL